MTGHQLARELLALPDLPVITIDDDEVPMAIVQANKDVHQSYDEYDEPLGEQVECVHLGTDPFDDTPRR